MNRQKFDLKSPKLNGKKVTKRFFSKKLSRKRVEEGWTSQPRGRSGKTLNRRGLMSLYTSLPVLDLSNHFLNLFGENIKELLLD